MKKKVLIHLYSYTHQRERLFLRPKKPQSTHIYIYIYTRLARVARDRKKGPFRVVRIIWRAREEKKKISGPRPRSSRPAAKTRRRRHVCCGARMKKKKKEVARLSRGMMAFFARAGAWYKERRERKVAEKATEELCTRRELRLVLHRV